MRYFLTALPMLLGMGLAGMLHCAGMCGGFAALATGSRRWSRLPAYLTGKAGSYILLGALAGALGEILLKAIPLDAGARVLAVIASVFLLLAGLDSLGVIRLNAAGFNWMALSSPLAKLGGEGASGALLIGAANGLLPCPMTMGFLAVAAGTGSAIWGAATLVTLGITTAVPMAACGVLGYRLGRWRKFPARGFAGALMLALALATLYRGLVLPPGAMHHMH